MDNIWLLQVIAVHFKVDLIAHVYTYMFCFLFYFCTPFMEITQCQYPRDTRKNQIFQIGVTQTIPSTQNQNYDENISPVLIVEDTIW